MLPMALEQFSGWTFISPCPIPNDVHELMAPGEQPLQAFKTVRDSAIFTNKRLIVRDSQGLSGKKVEMYSIPFKNVSMWSTENAGKMLDWNAELEMWTKAGHFKINLSKGIDIRAIDRLIASCVLSA